MIAFLVAPMMKINAQVPGNQLTGSSMEEADASAWTVVISYRDDLNDDPEYMFGSDAGCTNCTDNGLEVWADGAGYTNIIFYQPITLKAGHTYKANAAYKSLDVLAQNNWTQLKIGIDTFPQNENDGVKLLGTNAWNGCGQTEDGMLQDIACDGVQLTHGWVAPDTLGAEFDAWFAIVIGMWTNADNQYPYDLILDDVVLIDSAEALASVEPVAIEDNLLLTNFPNPFTGRTTIQYEIPETANVKLSVFNLMGQRVAEFDEGVRQAGVHQREIEIPEMGNNVLICKLEYNNQVLIRKMTMLQ